MTEGEARPLLAGALGLLALGLLVGLRLDVTTDITHFLPTGESGDDLRISRELATSELTRTLVLVVEADSRERALEAGRELEAALADEPDVARETAQVVGGPQEGLEEALWTLYHPRRLSFLAPSPAALDEALSEEGLRAAAVRLRQQLALPLSTLLTRVAPDDPTLALPALLERLRGDGEQGLDVVDGRFVTADGRGAVLLLTTRSAATDSRVQRPVLDGIERAFSRVEAASEGPLELALSGASRFAVRSEDEIRATIALVSIGSAVGLTLLLVSLFRSLRLVLLVLPVVGAGFLGGTGACLLLFGEVHGLTLAFGAALIGVSIDYAIHFHCHQTLAPDPGGPRSTLRRIWRGLALSAATTVTGFLALLASGFPGLRELAVFSASGIAAALVATRLFLPGLAVERSAPAATRRLALGISSRLRAPRRGLLVLPGALLVLALVGVPRLRWNDDLAAMNRLDAELVAEDEAVRERVTRFDGGRFVLALAEDEERALQVNDRVAVQLSEARAADELAGFRSLATLLPSARLQREVAERVQQDPDLWPRLERVLAEEGFVPERFHGFRDALEATPPPPLVLADLEASPLGPLVRPFRVTLEEGVGVVTFLRGPLDAAGLERRLASVDGARLVDVGGTLGGAFGRYRARMLRLSLLGLVGVLGVVALRHRSPRATLAATLPAVLAAAATVAVLALAGHALNVLSLVALLMVVSMGVDYGVLLAETHGEEGLAATHLAVLVAGSSTILGFGLLALSDQPALLTIGLTAGIGVLLCLLLAPTVHALLHAKRS